MGKFIKRFPGVFKSNNVIMGHSAAEVRISVAVKALRGTFLQRGHMFSEKECTANNCWEFHCQHWIPPKKAKLYQISHRKRDTYYLLLFKNGREIFIEARGGKGCVDIKICKYNQFLLLIDQGSQ